MAVTANSGTRPLSITVIRNVLSDKPEVRQIPPGPVTDEGVLASVFMGIAIAPDNRTIYASGGQENKVYIFDGHTGSSLGEIDCAEHGATGSAHGYIGDMKMTSDGKILYAVDQINFSLLIIDINTSAVRHRVPVGRYPFGVALSRDGQKVYVANVGMFEYSRIMQIENGDTVPAHLGYPPFAYGSDEAREGIFKDSLAIRGLGEINAPESFSVFAIDVSNPEIPRVVKRIKTGHLVGAVVEGIPAVGGSSPNSLVATEKYVFVSNGNNDNISVIDIRKDTVVHEIFLKPDPKLNSFRGVIPFGLCLSPDHSKLYVAESGINSVGVVDIESFEVEGHIPVGWFPSKVAVSRDGKKLIVANAKGFGSGPNGGPAFDLDPFGSYIGHLMRGTVTIADIPTGEALQQATQKVIDNNYRFSRADDAEHAWRNNNPVPLYPGARQSPIQHIVFIAKENRTYDEVFGQVAKGKGEPSLARYGANASFSNKAGTDSVVGATVMPNHLKLAMEYAISDNFYVDSDVSADGHRWLVNTYPNEWVETTTAASYGGNRRFREDSRAPGVYAMNGAAGAIYPEDYNEAGSMWDHLGRHGVDFYNFGFSVMFEPAFYDEQFKYTGIRHFVNFPLPAQLFDKTSKTYPTYNMAIPDQFRIDMFIREFNEKWIEGAYTMPPIITVIIPNDHGADDRPEAGYPFRESYMADNDLAVGRIVEYLSHTKYWKNMLIVITEDDAQNGVDHVDAHRSLLIVVSPWVKRNYMSSVHYSFGSLFKTFWNVLDLPYLNQYDAAASDLADFFRDSADFTPYNALPVDSRIFEPQKALDPFDETFDWSALEQSPALDHVPDMVEDSKERDEYRLEDRE
jgi:YVTN family beta-propeller protein